MGCCSSTLTNKAFRRDLSLPLLEELSSSMKDLPDARVFILRLNCLKNLRPTGISGQINAYVDVKLLKPDDIAGPQLQASSIKPKSANPKWDPPERFQISVSNPQDAKIIVSVYHVNLVNHKNPAPLGDCLIKLSNYNKLNEIKIVNLKLISPTDGQHAGEAEFSIQCLLFEDALNVKEQIAYEYQRWQPLKEWGNTDPPGHLLLTDPGRWCNQDGTFFGPTIDSVIPILKEGWTVSVNWHTISTDNDPEGWQYSTNFDSPFWHDASKSTYYVRRRTWHRTITKVQNSYVSPTVPPLQQKKPTTMSIAPSVSAAPSITDTSSSNIDSSTVISPLAKRQSRYKSRS